MLMFQQQLSVSDVRNFENNAYSRDPVAKKILRSCGRCDNIHALKVSGDGNCLFNSLSMAVCGTEVRSLEMRWQCVFELILNEDYYKSYHASNSSGAFNPSFNEACHDALIEHLVSFIWFVHVGASVLQRPIHSVYSSVNGLLDQTANILDPRINIEDD